MRVRKREHHALLVGLSSEYITHRFAVRCFVHKCNLLCPIEILSALTHLFVTGSFFSYIADADGDYIDIKTDKWSSGGYRMDCMDKGSHTGWQCWASCSPFPNPNFMDWGYLTFEVRVSGVFDDVCKPSISITKRWPMYGSKVVTLGK